MNWYLVHTKPRQERTALHNLEQQGYECYLPTLPLEKQRAGQIRVVIDPLFPRYLFIRLGLGESARSWHPIRSTKGVNRLVTFGNQPTMIDTKLVEQIMAREVAMRDRPTSLFSHGEQVVLTQGALAGIEGIYEMAEGEHRAVVLIDILSKSTAFNVVRGSLRKVV